MGHLGLRGGDAMELETLAIHRSDARRAHSGADTNHKELRLAHPERANDREYQHHAAEAEQESLQACSIKKIMSLAPVTVHKLQVSKWTRVTYRDGSEACVCSVRPSKCMTTLRSAIMVPSCVPKETARPSCASM